MAKTNHSPFLSLALFLTLVASPIAAPYLSVPSVAAQEANSSPNNADSNTVASPSKISAIEGLIPLLFLLLLGGGLWLLRKRSTTTSTPSSHRDRQPDSEESAPPKPEADSSLIPPVVPPAPGIDLPPVLPTETTPPAVGLPPAGAAIAGAGGIMGIVGAGMSPDLSEVASDDETSSDAAVPNATDEPAIDEPITGEPAIDEPVIIESAIGETDESAIGETDESAAADPVTDESAADESVIDEPTAESTIAPTIAAGTAIAAGKVLSPLPNYEMQSDAEASRYDVGQASDSTQASDRGPDALASVDDQLPDLPTGYGESRIVLMARDPQWAYTYWDIANEHKEALRRQGGTRLALRFCDVTDLDIAVQRPHTVQQYDCEEIAQDWYLPIPISDRDYLVEIGYLTDDGRWLVLARSAPVRMPPIYPTNWSNEQFLTVNWEDDIQSQPQIKLEPPKPSTNIHDTMYSLSLGGEAQRISGSLYGSMQAVSSYGLVSGAGMMSGIGMSGAGMSGIGMSGIGMSGIGMSGIGMSGVGMMSGVGFSASMPPIRPRKFWLIADAELIVYGATEPDATVTIGGQTIKLNPDGTFRFHLAFPDGNIDFPILAIAADGVQTRSIHLTFNRETPERNTNSKDEATDEWFT